MCAGSLEGRLYTGLHQKSMASRVREVRSHRSGETPPGVPCPALEPSAQERHRSVQAVPEEGHKNDPMAGTPLL